MLEPASKDPNFQDSAGTLGKATMRVRACLNRRRGRNFVHFQGTQCCGEKPRIRSIEQKHAEQCKIEHFLLDKWSIEQNTIEVLRPTFHFSLSIGIPELQSRRSERVTSDAIIA